MRQEQSRICTGPGVFDKVVFQPHTPQARAVAEIMQSEVATIRPDTPAYEAVSLMVGNDVSALPVVGDTGLEGMISEKDILKLIVGSQSLSDTVADLMTREIVTCCQETSVGDICACLAASSFRHIPVVQAGKLVGLVGRNDVIHAYGDRYGSDELSSGVPTEIDGPLARDVMTRGLLTVRPEIQIHHVMGLLTRWEVTGLPVVDDRLRLVGVVSEKDVLGVLCRPDIAPASVHEFMTTEIVSFEEKTPLLDICTALARSEFRRVPILHQGGLTGIISRRDLIIYLLRSKSQAHAGRSAACARRNSDLPSYHLKGADEIHPY